MNHLNKFSNNSEYNQNKNNLELPNVSMSINENEVHYNPYVDPYNGHTYVDLGLPSGTKWATKNIGANNITDYGNYYMYGKGTITYNKNNSIYSGIENPLDLSVDTVRLIMGGQWHTPTRDQLDELRTKTTLNFVTSYNGVNRSGFTFTASNGNVLFIPGGGFYSDGSLYNRGSVELWSSTPDTSTTAYYLDLDSQDSSFRIIGCDERSFGYNIRGVVG